MQSRSPSLLAVLALLLPAVAAAANANASTVDPTLWPEAQREFFQDGPGLLLDDVERRRITALDEAERQRYIDELLARDPVPETEVNELAIGIERRRELARQRFLTPTDVRYRLLFLNGPPSERLELDCGMTFKPIELWTWNAESPAGRRGLDALAAQHRTARVGPGEEGKVKFKGWKNGPRLVVYRPGPGSPYRLWEPFDAKRTLYSSEMEYYLEQYEELRHLISSKRFDLQTCEETLDVEAATGVRSLTDYVIGRPSRDTIMSFLEPPADLAAWARQAAATPLPDAEKPALSTSPVTLAFPARQGQRIVVRMLTALDAEQLELDEEGELQVAIDGVLESEGEVFSRTRVRYSGEPPPEGQPLALAVDTLLRPGTAFVVRLEVKDQIGGGVAYTTTGFSVPEEPVVADAERRFEDAIVLGEKLAQEAAKAGNDSLLLAPPIEGEVVLGLWRADALITGRRIAKVSFLVDGVPQMTRNQPPYTAEVRLATYPTEQVVRAEGYDAQGELVAADEVVVNQPRGAFRVAIIEPRRGATGFGEVEVRAEVVVPEETSVEAVEFRLNDEVVATLTKPPWRTKVTVGRGSQLTYVSAAAILDDERRAEDVRFLNAPAYLEQVDVRLLELYTTVTDRSGRLVRGLDRSDFTVLENGSAQEISKFELVENLPLTVGITIDTSGSMRSALTEAQRAGRDFLANVVTRRDRCFVVGFSSKPILLMPPTDDVDACSAGLDGLQAVGWTTLHDAVVTSLYYMREFRGQRALVLISDGDDTQSSIDFDDALEYARRSGAVIFSVGLSVEALQAGVRGKLTKLAEETGGRSFFIKKADELDEVYDEIEAELRSRYLLAYTSDQANGDDGFREVEVKVGQRGLKARTIRGYYPGGVGSSGR